MKTIRILAFFALVFTSSCINTHNNATSKALVLHGDPNTIPVVILGAGTGGLTASIYLAQANLNPVIIAGHKLGGALTQSHSVRNWPGVIDAPGAVITENIKNHALANNVIILQEKVIRVDFSQHPFVITTQSLEHPDQQKTIKALSCIIAMGTEPHYLGIPGETGPHGYWGHGVSNCAVCEGPLYKDKNVLIVGGGDAAIAEASYLAGIAKTVTIIVRKDHLRAKDLRAQELVLARPNVTLLLNTELKEIIGDGRRITHAKLYTNKTSKSSCHPELVSGSLQETIPIDGIFLAIGSSPNTVLFKGQLELDTNGFIVRKNIQETSIEGVFAIGDVTDHEFVQAITAAGDGCKAALQTKKYLEKIGYRPSGNNKEMQTHIAQDTIQDVQNNTHEKSRNTKSLIQEIESEHDFNKLVVQEKSPVIIDIFAPLCFSCKQLEPVLEELAHKHHDHAVFVKFNIASKKFNAPVLIKKLGGKDIDAAPTIILVQDGKEETRIIETEDHQKVKTSISNFLKN